MSANRKPKTLVVCCDGTWQKSDNRYVSNVEKIARAVAPVGHDGETQFVHYQRGVGSSGSRIERLLAGAFGIGLDDNLLECYYFLALNYSPGDRISVFGFSRGAYTARSLVGMISYVGLLRPDGVARDLLPKAMQVYRGRPAAGATAPQKHMDEKAVVAEFCQDPDDVAVDFLGVFDTVGALGVPGIPRKKYEFHDVTLSAKVSRARQALALAERRRVFAPCLWGGWHRDIRQVWFDGVHCDVGGGYPNCFYSDRSLLWMVGEAAQRGRLKASVHENVTATPADYDDYAGLKFDWSRFEPGLCRVSAVENDSMSPLYRVTNAVAVIRGLWRRAKPGVQPAFVGGWRNLSPSVDIPATPEGRAYDVRIDRGAGRRSINPNMARWVAEVTGVLTATAQPSRSAVLTTLENLYVTPPGFRALSAVRRSVGPDKRIAVPEYHPV